MKRLKRVAIFCDFLNSVGGTEYYNVMLATELKKRGIDVKVFIGEKTSLEYWTTILNQNNITYYEVDEKHFDLLDRKIEMRFMSKVFKIFDEWMPDIIHCSPAGKMFIAFLTSSYCRYIPIVATEYTTPSRATAHWYQPDLSNYINEIDALIATCNASAQGIRSFHNYAGPVHIIKHLIKHKEAQQVEELPESVGCIARLSPEKGVGFLIGAFKHVVQHFPKAKLFIYGQGPYEQYLKELAKSMDLNTNVVFSGVFSPSLGINSIVNKHKIFVQPSLFESISTSTIELMGHSRAIVATDAGGTKELITESSGILVPIASSDALANGIIGLLSNRTKCEEYGNNAKKSFDLQYDLDTNIEKIIQLYERVTGR